MKEFVYNFDGSTDFSAAKDCYVEVRSTGAFTVLDVDGHILGPDSVGDRVFKLFLHKDEHIVLQAEDSVHFTLRESILPPRGEVVSSESLVEIVPKEEMSVYDRLRAELLAQFDKIAAVRDMDTWDDEEDYDVDDEDWETPLTPYEYKEMYEEWLKDNPEKVDEVNEVAEKPTGTSTVDSPPNGDGAASASNAE